MKHVEMNDGRLEITVTMPKSGHLSLIGSPGETILVRQITGDPHHAPLVVMAESERSVPEDGHAFEPQDGMMCDCCGTHMFEHDGEG